MLRTLKYVVLIAIAAFLVTCSEDDPAGPPPTPNPYQDLTKKEHVLQNLAAAWNNRAINPYDELLDADFIFFFDVGDVGGNIPQQWGREVEINVARNMFNPNYAGPNPLTSIEVTLEGLNNLQWVPMQPQDPKFAGETWYTTTVIYHITLNFAPDIEFSSTGNPKGQFTVRAIGIEGTPYWRLVQWRDFANGRALVRVPTAH